MLMRLGSLMGLWRKGRLTWNLLWDPRVPSAAKMMIPGALLYGLMPIDLVPDFLLALGQLDDLTLLLLAVTLFLRLAPAKVVREHLERQDGRRPPHEPPQGSGKVIDGDYRVVE